MRLIFMGTPEFSAVVLRGLFEAGYDVGLVVTQPDRPGNRGKKTFSPVKQAALDAGVRVLQPEYLSRSEEAEKALREYDPDVVIIVAYGQILKKNILDIPRFGCFNIHASLLPHLRGASPIQHAILEGAEVTGVTIMKIGEGLDDGDMVAKAELPVDGRNYAELSEALSILGRDLLLKTLPKIESGDVVYTPQEESLATYAGMIRKADGRLDFSRSASELERQVRAFDPWPGAFVEAKNGRIKIWRTEALEETGISDGIRPGTVMDISEGIDVACGSGVLRILELQLPGKKRVFWADFLRGHRIPAGTVFAADL